MDVEGKGKLDNTFFNNRNSESKNIPKISNQKIQKQSKYYIY